MSLDDMIISESEDILKQEREREEAELKKEIDTGDSYSIMKRTDGWKMLEQMMIQRSSQLNSRLLVEKDHTEILRVQGELLGVQSVLNIVDSAIQLAEENKEILKGEPSNEQS